MELNEEFSHCELPLWDVVYLPRLVLHQGRCYYPENCPCAWLGLEYLPGETVETPCYKWYVSSTLPNHQNVQGLVYHFCWRPVAHLTSVCHRGYFNCTYFPCPAVCTIYSDRHYHTFDGLEYDYHTDCQVYLLKVSLHSLIAVRFYAHLSVAQNGAQNVFLGHYCHGCVCEWRTE